MNRINKMIELNSKGRLNKVLLVYKTVKDIVYNGDSKKAYESLYK